LVNDDVDVVGLRTQATELRDRRDGLAAMLADGLLSTTAARKQAVTITERLHDVERRIEAASGTSPLAALIGADDVRAAWQALDLEAQRTIVRALFETVTIMPAEHRGAKFDPELVIPAWRIAL
jgi:site-specific DNA recombinase